MQNPACLSALLLAGLLQAPPVEPGWTSLFNGTDFTGSKISKPESFRIENGTIVANGVASHKDKNIVVKVNDKQTVDWAQPADWNGGREGPGRAITGAGGTIALQAHDPKSTVYLKNIRIKPLD